MNLDNTFFASMNLVTKHMNAQFFQTLNHLTTTLMDPETASAGAVGTDDYLAPKAKQVDEECLEILANLRTAAQKTLDIYNEVTLLGIDVVAGSMVKNGAYMSIK